MKVGPDTLSVPLPLRPREHERLRKTLLAALRRQSFESLVAAISTETPANPVTKRIFTNLSVLYSRVELTAWVRARVRAVIGGADHG